MKTIKITDIYNVSNPVDMACELLYMCEIAKHIKSITAKNEEIQISIEGVNFTEQIQGNPIWSYFCKNIVDKTLVGADKNIDLEPAKLWNVKYVQDILMVAKTSNKEKMGELPILFDVSENNIFFKDKQNMSMLIRGNEKQTWVSILAFFTIRKYLYELHGNNTDIVLNIMLSKETMNRTGAISYLMLLYNTLSINNWVNIIVVNSTITHKKSDEINIKESAKPIEEVNTGQLNYEAWLQDGRDKGLVDEKYKAREKDYDFIRHERIKAIKKANIEVNDVVALYTLYEKEKNNNNISNVDFAVVRNITNSKIDLEIVKNKKTKLDIKCEMSELGEDEKGFFAANILNKNTTEINLNLTDVGVNQDVYKEKFFIVTLDNIEDTVESSLEIKGSIVKKILTQQQYVYLILNDYDIDFNKDKYFELYLSKKN